MSIHTKNRFAQVETTPGDVDFGSDGPNPPANPGTGVLGWLRGIYERLTGNLKVQVINFPSPNPLATEVSVVNRVSLSDTTIAALNSHTVQDTRITLIAGQSLNAYKAIVTDSSGNAILASAGNSSHAGRVIGLSINAAITGDSVTVQSAGEVTNSGWNWPPGALIYVGLNGDLTTSQVGVFSQAVGFARTSTIIVVRISRAIFRS